MTKNNNRVFVSADGNRWHSKREYDRWMELQLLARAGKIRNLDRQVRFELIPAQYETGPDGKRRCVERACTYTADFTYEMPDDAGNWTKIVEDVKGCCVPSSSEYARYVIKRKLMLWRHGVQIREVG